MLDVIKEGANILKIIIPIGAMFAIVIFAGSIFKWWNSFNDSIREIFRSPGRFVFALIIIIILVFFFYKYIWPLISGVL